MLTLPWEWGIIRISEVCGVYFENFMYTLKIFINIYYNFDTLKMKKKKKVFLIQATRMQSSTKSS